MTVVEDPTQSRIFTYVCLITKRCCTIYETSSKDQRTRIVERAKHTFFALPNPLS